MDSRQSNWEWCRRHASGSRATLIGRHGEVATNSHTRAACPTNTSTGSDERGENRLRKRGEQCREIGRERRIRKDSIGTECVGERDG